MFTPVSSANSMCFTPIREDKYAIKAVDKATIIIIVKLLYYLQTYIKRRLLLAANGVFIVRIAKALPLV